MRNFNRYKANTTKKTHLLAKVQGDLSNNGTRLRHSQTVARHDHHLLRITQSLCKKEEEEEDEKKSTSENME